MLKIDYQLILSVNTRAPTWKRPVKFWWIDVWCGFVTIGRLQAAQPWRQIENLWPLYSLACDDDLCEMISDALIDMARREETEVLTTTVLLVIWEARLGLLWWLDICDQQTA